MNNIRNFCIIAHVDHGKSTLADRFLEITGTVEKRKMKEQYLDQLELERERGITIKMAPVRMLYKHSTQINTDQNADKRRLLNNNISNNQCGNPQESAQVEEYILNLIDTPGHTDFSYEVSRALTAVEGAILLVDATQGIQAQTLANFNSAKKAGLKIIGAVNKVDLDLPMIDEVIKSTAELLGVDESEIFKVSGKTGQGVKQLLDAIIKDVPPPKATDLSRFSTQINTDIRENPCLDQQKSALCRALVFDSFYHEHKGIVAAVRVFSAGGGSAFGGNGSFIEGADAHLIATNIDFKIKELGYFAPELKKDLCLGNGEIGYIATGLKNPDALKIGDTLIANYQLPITNYQKLILPGYKDPQPVVYVSFYPEAADDYEDLKNALGKLKLNDSSLKYDADFNEFLGRGFKTGFLGKLHFEITAERLEKEFHMKTVHSFPSVAYKIKRKPNSDYEIINNPKDFPADYIEVMEPIAKVEIFAPKQYVGSIIQLQDAFRLRDLNTKMIGGNIIVSANLPLADLIRDFDDQLKSVSAGYASLNYEVSDYQKTDVVKMDVLIAGHEISGLTRIIHREDIERESRKTVEKLKELLPRQQFMQAIQAVIGGRVIARESIPAMKKDVTGYLYGGDRTRKMKLWKKQQRGKEKLKGLAMKGKIDVPASVFKELLKK